MLAGLKGRETALTWALKNKHSNDNVYNNMNFKYYKSLSLLYNKGPEGAYIIK